MQLVVAKTTPTKLVAILLLPLRAIAEIASATINPYFVRRFFFLIRLTSSFNIILMLFFCLSRYSYIKCTENCIYIANQSTGKQIIYDANCEDFVKEITRTPQEINDVVHKISLCFNDVDISIIYNDFVEFLNLLSEEGFVIIADNLVDIKLKENESINLHLDVPPITDLTIEITNRCNERCIHCYLPPQLKDQGTIMKLDKAQKLIDEFAEMGGKTITLTGGEVLLHKDLLALLSYIQEKHLQIIIYSNLIALSEETLKEIKRNNVSYIQVSLYGITPIAHDTITGKKGSCVRTKQSIERLKGAGIPIRIVCPVMRENRNDIINVLKFAKDKDIPIELELNITPREDQSNDNLKHRLSINEMESLLIELREYDKGYMDNLLHRHKYVYDKTFNFAEYINYPICTAGHYGLYITANGKVATCPNLQGAEIAHINNASLREIWYENENIMELRKITEGSFLKCISCDASDYCFRCFARNYTETGNLIEFPEYACQMAFLAKKIVES